MKQTTQSKVRVQSTSTKQLAAIINTSKGAAVINLPSDIKGQKLEDTKKAIKKQSEAVIAKKEALNNYLDRTLSLSQVLKAVKLDAKNYVQILEAKYEVKVTDTMILDIIPSLFLTLQTEKEKELQSKHPNRWKFSKVLTLIARYYKNKLSTEKLALRTEKALSKLEA